MASYGRRRSRQMHGLVPNVLLYRDVRCSVSLVLLNFFQLAMGVVRRD